MEGNHKPLAKSSPSTQSPERNRVRKDAEKLTLREARESLGLKLSKR